MNINERIKYIVDMYFKGNASEFARTIGVPQPTIKDIIGGKLSKPGYDVLEKIINEESLNISPSWLMREQGAVVNVGDNSTGNVVGSISGGHIISIPNFGGKKIIKGDGEIELQNSAQSLETWEIERNSLNQRIADLENMVNMKDEIISTLKENISLLKKMTPST